MAFTAEFQEAVSQGRVMRVRIMLKDSLLLDPEGKEFECMLDYAKERMEALTDDHDGEKFLPEGEWKEEYFNEQMVAVVNNFSEERLGLLKRMAAHLFKRTNQEAESVSGDAAGALPQAGKRGPGAVRKTGFAVAAAGAAMLTGGILAEVPVIAVCGGIAAAAGGSMIVLSRKSN